MRFRTWRRLNKCRRKKWLREAKDVFKVELGIWLSGFPGRHKKVTK